MSLAMEMSMKAAAAMAALAGGRLSSGSPISDRGSPSPTRSIEVASPVNGAKSKSYSYSSSS
jgi:hypothetical protein